MTGKSPITTHVLDTSRGCPASGIAVRLERHDDTDQWSLVGEGNTDEDGRITDLVEPAALAAARYRMTFDTGAYVSELGIAAFYPQVIVEFETTTADDHYHIPLLLNPFGYSTYRGS